METTPLSTDLLWCWVLIVMVAILGPVTMWWERRQKRKQAEDEEE